MKKDDLTQVKYIGTARMKLLNDSGITTISQLSKTPLESLARIGTIDLRIDYLRPGKGTHFYARSKMMRTGRKVSVTRMDLHNDVDLLIAVGTGTYIVG
mgnify:CR=1 FL=1